MIFKVAGCISLFVFVATTLSAGTLVGPGEDHYDRELGVERENTSDPIPYELFRPPNHESGDDLPLVVFLHGLGNGVESQQARLNDTFHDLLHAAHRENVDRGVQCMDATGNVDDDCGYFDDQYESFLLVPRRPLGNSWSGTDRESIVTIVEDLTSRYAIDESRIYVTGYSNGAFAALGAARHNPDVFAAAVSMAGGSSAVSAAVVGGLQDIPIWLFHGDADSVVSPNNSIRLHDALEARAGNSRLTLVPGGTHAISAVDEAFIDDDNVLYPWLFSQSLAVPEPGSSVTLMIGLAMFVAARRRKLARA